MSDRSGLRLRSVRFKDGGSLAVLRPEQDYDRRIVESGFVRNRLLGMKIEEWVLKDLGHG
jgi:hypothetical protein